MGIAIPVLIFTTHSSGLLGPEVRDAGAQGYVVKSQAAHSLMVAIETILAGGTFLGSPDKFHAHSVLGPLESELE